MEILDLVTATLELFYTKYEHSLEQNYHDVSKKG
jgi:hypothetical protein